MQRPLRAWNNPKDGIYRASRADEFEVGQDLEVQVQDLEAAASRVNPGRARDFREKLTRLARLGRPVSCTISKI